MVETVESVVQILQPEEAPPPVLEPDRKVS